MKSFASAFAWSIGALLIGVLAIAEVRTCHAELVASWPRLPQGRFAVGFRSSYALDYAHLCDPVPREATGYRAVKTPRPVLLNVWYPATTPPRGQGSAPPLQHRDYLPSAAPQAAVKAYVERLQRFTMQVIANDVFRGSRELASLGPDERKLLDEFLDRSTGTVRDAPHAAGRFPLVLYRHGVIATYEENAPLFELLASHGYIVASAAYDPAETYDLQPVNLATRFREEMEFVLSLMHADPHVDFQRIVAMGHSMGAQTAIGMAMQNPIIDAVISLDTTFDCWVPPIVMKLHKDWADVLTEPRRLSVPLLNAAASCAKFDVVRSFRYSPRTLLRVGDLEHDDFIWHGVAGALLLKIPKAKEVRDQYEAVLLYSYHFLNAYVRGDVASGQFLSRPAATLVPGVKIDVEQLPALPPPPDAGEIAQRIKTAGKEQTTAWLKEMIRRDPEALPVDLLAGYTRTLDLRGQQEAGKALAHILVELYPAASAAHVALAELLDRHNAPCEAITAYEAALRCFPNKLSGTQVKAQAQTQIADQLNYLKSVTKCAPTQPARP